MRMVSFVSYIRVLVLLSWNVGLDRKRKEANDSPICRSISKIPLVLRRNLAKRRWKRNYYLSQSLSTSNWNKELYVISLFDQSVRMNPYQWNVRAKISERKLESFHSTKSDWYAPIRHGNGGEISMWSSLGCCRRNPCHNRIKDEIRKNNFIFSNWKGDRRESCWVDPPKKSEKDKESHRKAIKSDWVEIWI